jgi:hypothetical protein
MDMGKRTLIFPREQLKPFFFHVGNNHVLEEKELKSPWVKPLFPQGTIMSLGTRRLSYWARNDLSPFFLGEQSCPWEQGD